MRKHGICYHMYADDTQMYLSIKPDPNSSCLSQEKMEKAIDDIRNRMADKWRQNWIFDFLSLTPITKRLFQWILSKLVMSQLKQQSQLRILEWYLIQRWILKITQAVISNMPFTGYTTLGKSTIFIKKISWDNCAFPGNLKAWLLQFPIIWTSEINSQWLTKGPKYSSKNYYRNPKIWTYYASSERFALASSAATHCIQNLTAHL